jgi:hypothetical protein
MLADCIGLPASLPIMVTWSTTAGSDSLCFSMRACPVAWSWW